MPRQTAPVYDDWSLDSRLSFGTVWESPMFDRNPPWQNTSAAFRGVLSALSRALAAAELEQNFVARNFKSFLFIQLPIYMSYIYTISISIPTISYAISTGR